MLGFCGGLVLLYRPHYFGSLVPPLNALIVLFLVVMGFLVTSGDLVSRLVFWEYLGFVRFLLILFYRTFDAAFAAKVTLISSRFGDVGLFVLVAGYLVGFSCLGTLGSLCFFLVVARKRAVIPFSSWLLEAMRAPTPVSSLVHSSTLVAAGVWFCVRFEYFSDGLVTYLGISCCLLTVGLRAFGALYLSDIKKIVALSTCNNIS